MEHCQDSPLLSFDLTDDSKTGFPFTPADLTNDNQSDPRYCNKEFHRTKHLQVCKTTSLASIFHVIVHIPYTVVAESTLTSCHGWGLQHRLIYFT
jgi:hypothetical protein